MTRQGGHKLSRDAAAPGGCPALPALPPRQWPQQKAPKLHPTKLLCTSQHRAGLELRPPSSEGKRGAGARPEGGFRSEHEGIFNNEPVINPDRHAALGIAFQLLLVGGQIIPFHHISH